MNVYAVGTAAVREAKRRQRIRRRVEREIGIKLRILSGEDEARLSALGVLAGAPDARGIVGDLGGASLELIEISPKGPGSGETFPLGPLALMEARSSTTRARRRNSDAALDQGKVLNGKGDVFYAVGGAWRALGRIDIALRRSPDRRVAPSRNDAAPTCSRFAISCVNRARSRLRGLRMPPPSAPTHCRMQRSCSNAC